MAIIKKYNQYIKKINEDFDFPEGEIQDEVKDEVQGEISDESDYSEEEGHQYKGNRMLAELADKLGAEVVDNSVEYNGKVINFFSETEMYHVDRKKFKTADEVVEYLSSEGGNDISDEAPDFDNETPVLDDEKDFSEREDEERYQRRGEEELTSESKSYRRTRTFKSFGK